MADWTLDTMSEGALEELIERAQNTLKKRKEDEWKPGTVKTIGGVRVAKGGPGGVDGSVPFFAMIDGALHYAWCYHGNITNPERIYSVASHKWFTGEIPDSIGSKESCDAIFRLVCKS